MSKQDLKDILTYAKVNHLEHIPFQDVINSYNKELQDWYILDQADSWVMAMKDEYDI